MTAQSAIAAIRSCRIFLTLYVFSLSEALPGGCSAIVSNIDGISGNDFQAMPKVFKLLWQKCANLLCHSGGSQPALLCAWPIGPMRRLTFRFQKLAFELWHWPDRQVCSK